MQHKDEAPSVQDRLLHEFARAKIRPYRGEALRDFLRRQTHIYMHGQGLHGAFPDSVPLLVPKASVVYGYGNQLTDVSALARLSALKMLYLQVISLTP